MPDLGDISRELRATAARAPDEARDVVKRGAQNIKSDWQRRLRDRSRHGHIPHLPRAVGYDVTSGQRQTTANIGYRRGAKQAGLGHLLEFGSVNNPPGFEGARALRTEAPRFYGAIARLEGGFP